MTPVELVLSKVQGIVHRKDGIWARCPAHDDQDPSLKIWEGDDGAACVKCHSHQCSTVAILGAIGLQKKHLFPEKPKDQQPKRRAGRWKQIVREYSYVDESGVQLHQTVRFEPKKFMQRRWDSFNNKWSWSLLGIRTVLYGLPRLLEAIAAGKEIFLAEGEKDVEAFWQRGLEATTNPMGACNWKPEYTEVLKGARITIVRDPDKAGYKRCASLYKELSAAGCFVRAVQAAIEKNDAGEWIVKDAFDHFEAGRTVDEFEPVDPLEKWKEPKQTAAEAPELAYVKGGAPQSGAEVAPPPNPPPAAVVDERRPRRYHLTDLGNAQRLVDQFGEDLRYCPQFGAWLMWAGQRWQLDETEGAPIHRMVGEVIKGMHQEANEMEFGSNARKDLFKHAMQSESRRSIEAMIALAKKEPGIPVLPDQLDADDWVAGASNGTIDLRTGELREPRREDLITKQLGVPYIKDAKCQDFKDWLFKALGEDQGLYSYVLRVMGYSLTGSIREEMFIFAHGPGGGGKGTLFKVLQKVLGEYAGILRSEALMAKQHEQIPADIAKLKGVRAAFIDETEENKRFNEALLKQMTGGGPVQARFMRENFFEFLPKFKLFIAGNHKPRIISFDRAIERRLKLVPFDRPIPDDQIDTTLKDRLASTQGEGVLALMVQSCLLWQKDGLKQPNAVTEAVREYREESDAVLRFIEERCNVDSFGEETPARELFKAYKLWSKTTEDYCGTETWFGRLISLKGYKKGKNTKFRFHEGLSLKRETFMGCGESAN